MSTSYTTRTGGANRRALMALALAGFTVGAFALTLDSKQTYEDQDPGPKSGGEGLVGGVAEVLPAGELAASQTLKLRAGTPAGQISYDIAWAPAGVYYVDFRVRPQATATDVEFVDADGALMALRKNGDGTASWRVYDGRLGLANGSGCWRTVGAPVVIGEDATSGTFTRVTLRMNYITKKFDVLLDGVPVAAEISLDDAAVTVPMSLDFYAQSDAFTALDDVLVTAKLPEGLPADADGDGMSDAWETAHGLNPNSAADRLADRDADGVSNVREAALSSTPGYAGVAALVGRTEIAGVMVREAWLNLPTTDLGWLRFQTKDFSKAPDRRGFVAGAASPVNWADNFGQRIRGFITIPKTGTYRFAVSGDDDSELRLAVDGSPLSAVRVAGFQGWTPVNQWGKYAGQQSGTYALTAGQRVYVEAIAKEAVGGDHLEIGWLAPGSTVFEAVPAAVVSSFAPVAADLDDDGLPDAWEIAHGLSATDNGSVSAVNGAGGDPDGDGLTNAAEYALGRNPIVGDFDPAVSVAGLWRMETWTGIATTSLDGLFTATKGFTTTPATRGFLKESFTAYNAGDTYGRRLRAWLTVPNTGDYVFAVSGDDDVQLRLGADEFAASAKPIAGITGGFTAPLEWTKYASQQSAAVRLLAGKRYYIESRMQEGWGNDHLEIGYRLATESASAIKLLPPAWLASYPNDPADADGDGLPDAWEVANGLSASDNGSVNSVNGPLGDPDNDGLTNAEELRRGTNPRVSDVPAPGGAPVVGALLRQRWTSPTFESVDALAVKTAGFTLAAPLTLNASAEVLEAGFAYGERLRGWITPKVTGDYSFALSSDDASRLYLSTDETVAAARPLAEITGWTNLRAYGAAASGVSAPVRLEAGKAYYVEMRHVTVGGPGHLSLAWRSASSLPWSTVPAEVFSAFNRVPAPGVTDADDDGFSDAWEIANGLSATDNGATAPVNGPAGDLDGDGLTNLQEYRFGLAANKADTAGDGVGDYAKVIAPMTGAVTRRVWPEAYQAALINGATPIESTMLTAAFRAITPKVTLLEELPPQNIGDRQLQEITGYLIAPETGDYVFALCTDDRGALYLSSDATPEGLRKVAAVANYAPYGNFTMEPGQRSAPVHLVAGQRYLFRAFGLDIGGADHVQLGWQRPGQTSVTPVPLSAMAPAAPLSLYTADGARLAFSDDDGDGLNNLREQQLGTNPTLVDTDGDGMSDADEVAAGRNPNHYTAANDLNGNGLPDSWELTQGWTVVEGVIEPGHSANDDPDGDGLTNAQEQEVGTHPALTDTDGDGLDDGLEMQESRDPLTVVESPANNPRLGYWLRDQWTRYADELAPFSAILDDYTTLPEFQAYRRGTVYTSMDQVYLCRLRAKIRVPAEGDYVFAIAGDNETELRLSPNARAANAVRIAGTVPSGYTAAQDWFKYAGQIASPVHLLPDFDYYIEIRHGQGVGGDGFGLGYRLAEEPDSQIRLVPDNWITSYSSIGDINENSLPDAWELAQGWTVVEGVIEPGYGSGDDLDHDGLTNLREYQRGTNPALADTDGDGMSDGDEVASGRDPLNPDLSGFVGENYYRLALPSSGIGTLLLNVEARPREDAGDFVDAMVSFHGSRCYLQFVRVDAGHGQWYFNAAEANDWHIPIGPVMPLGADGYSSADFVLTWDITSLAYRLYLNGKEVRQGILGNWPYSVQLNAQLPGAEMRFRGQGVQYFKESDDADLDGLTNRQEYQFGTHPLLADTDGDGMSDGDEVASGRNPLEASTQPELDSDYDGVTDALELQLGTNPYSWDSDGDGVFDQEEMAFGFNPLVLGDVDSDSDGDGFPDYCEATHASDPNDAGSVPEYDIVVDPAAAEETPFVYPYTKLSGKQVVRSVEGLNRLLYANYNYYQDTKTKFYPVVLIKSGVYNEQLQLNYGAYVFGDPAGAPVITGDSPYAGPAAVSIEHSLGYVRNVVFRSNRGAQSPKYATRPSSRLILDHCVIQDYPELFASLRVPTALVLKQCTVNVSFDTDGDGMSDADELVAGRDPLVADVVNNPADTNANGLPDAWEIAQGWVVTPGVVQSGHGSGDDPDGDGLTNLQEYQLGTNPLAPDGAGDTDGDGLPDGDELSQTGTDPSNAYSVGPEFNDSYGAMGYVGIERWSGFVALPTLEDFRTSGGVRFPADAGLVYSRTLSKRVHIAGASVAGGVMERVRGWYIPTVSGEHVFTLTQERVSESDTRALFRLSTDDTPFTARDLLRVDRGGFDPADSTSVTLEAGRRYYFEIWTRKPDAAADTRLDVVPPANP